ncbi:MAG: four-carbon acid sugar kinase family protein [Caldilineaceae bacterium]|nr:four-carbon acid sugar kinase family protein [Caldilineaceae bacterium]
MKSLLILADDLTGAADCAARCRYGGLSTVIDLQPPQPPLPVGAIAFTSDSRHLSAADAARRVAEIAAPLRSLDAHWYKKIDSTLRGNLGAELDALLDQLGRTCALICPAFPAQGRGLEDGYLIAPGLPPSSISLPQRLAESSHRPMEAIPLAAVRSNDLALRLAEATARGSQLLAVDARTDADLHQILNAVESALPDALLCGSAGLIGALALRLGQCGSAVDDPALRPVGDLRALLIVGSGSEMAHRQIETFCAARPATRLIVGPTRSPTADLDPSRPLLIHLPSPATGVILDGPLARRWAEALAAAAIPLIERIAPNLLILSGGDTAVSVLSRLGIDRLTVLAELLPGMPLCHGNSDAGRSYFVIMKPGSFGDETTFLTLLDNMDRFLSGETEI